MFAKSIICRIQHIATKIAYILSHSEHLWIKDRLIAVFLSHYEPNLKEALESDPFKYKSFNAFFTRQLSSNARKQQYGKNNFLSAADGTLSQIGKIEAGQLIQAKNIKYNVNELLGSKQLGDIFQFGLYNTVYLAPYDYHRVHMPLQGTLRCMIHIPGMLYSVNEKAANNIPNLFTKNERVVCIFETAHGPMAIIMVGATLVGSIETTWHGLIKPVGIGKIKYYNYQNKIKYLSNLNKYRLIYICLAIHVL